MLQKLQYIVLDSYSHCYEKADGKARLILSNSNVKFHKLILFGVM